MRAFVVLTCAALAGCAGLDTVMPSALRSPAAWSSMIYAAKDGPILVDVRGGALGATADAFAPLTARAMTGAVIGYPTTFTADPAQAPRRNFRTVVVLDPVGMSDDAACAGRIDSRPQGPGRLSVLAVFCNDDRPLAAATGQVGATAPSDPAVAGLMRALAREVFMERPRDFDDRDVWEAG